MLNAIVALYYYLMVIKVMYVDRNADESAIPLSRASGWALALPALAVLLLGTVAAQPVFEWAVRGAFALF